MNGRNVVKQMRDDAGNCSGGYMTITKSLWLELARMIEGYENILDNVDRKLDSINDLSEKDLGGGKNDQKIL